MLSRDEKKVVERAAANITTNLDLIQAVRDQLSDTNEDDLGDLFGKIEEFGDEIEKLAKRLLIMGLLVEVTGCEYILEPKPVVEPECKVAAISTTTYYGKLDTVAIVWKNNPPFCKYPAWK